MNRRTTLHAVQPCGDDPSLADAVTAFAALRPRLFAHAYRVLGSWTEAEDIVQDAWLRWQGCDRSAVVNSSAFLVAATTRLALNAAQSARARRETPVALWTTEPVDTSGDPAHLVGQDEELELGIQVVLETLTPTERAAYVLRQAFDYPYARIAELLQLSELNARQVVSRAGRRVNADRRSSVRDQDRRGLLRAFVAAARGGGFDELERVLLADVVADRLDDVPA